MKWSEPPVWWDFLMGLLIGIVITDAYHYLVVGV